jgi:excisionase family DNA binding protein
MQNLYTRKQLAEYFSVTDRTIDRWRKSGIIKGIKISKGVVRFTEEDVERVQTNAQV